MMREIGGSNEERWIKHYSSGHNILLVGEGDFSFSLCLAMAFGSATNIVATTLDSYEELIAKYKDAQENVAMLTALGASVLFRVDATKMKNLPDLWWRKFHRIIYNFPHAGFHGKEDNPNLITMHRNLVLGFLKNASSMLWPNGEIHVNHKTSEPFDAWKIEDLGSLCSLICTAKDEFNIKDYPWYCHKRGSGWTPDDSFPLGACRTFKFKLNLQVSPDSVPSPPPQQMFPTYEDYKSECHKLFGAYLDHVEETFGSSSFDVRRTAEEALRIGFATYVDAAPGRPLDGYIGILEELHQLTVLRTERLKLMLLLQDQHL
ncbi:hypothetical protein OROGR_029662 [Orobanche gracilis]